MTKKSQLLRDTEQIETLTRGLETEKQRSDELLTRLQYLQADSENLKKRFNRQIDDLKKHGTERIILEVINVIEELSLAIDCSSASEPNNSLIEGVKMTIKRLEKILENEGVSPIKSVGQPFDSFKHQAISPLDVNEVDACIVVEEIRKGYIMREKVIRPSTVKISAITPSKLKQGDK